MMEYEQPDWVSM